MKQEILHHREFGSADQPKIIILHGLFGSSQNWFTIATKLAEKFNLFALDLRNHGQSFHDDSHTIDDMVGDVYRWFLDHNIKSANLIGHSMGGLVAMKFADLHAGLVDKLTIVDIAPREYKLNYEIEFKALSVDLSEFNSRAEVDAAISTQITNKQLRQFLTTNISRDDRGYYWHINVEALKKAREKSVLQVKLNRTITLPTQFIIGEHPPISYNGASFVNKDDLQIIYDNFSNVQIDMIPKAGHWLHHSHAKEFLEKLTSFLVGAATF